MSRLLYSLVVIELSEPGNFFSPLRLPPFCQPHSYLLLIGLEATTYELIASVSNAGMSLSSIFATQLLTAVHATGCTTDDDDIDDSESNSGGLWNSNSTSSSCSSDSVDLTSVDTYEDSHGPSRFTKYTLLLSMFLLLQSFL